MAPTPPSGSVFESGAMVSCAPEIADSPTTDAALDVALGRPWGGLPLDVDAIFAVAG